jgi:hypothetical protein
VTTKREQVLDALQAALGASFAAAPAGPLQERNSQVATGIKAPGAVILRDGAPGDPEITLSPLSYHYAHAAEVLLGVDGARYASEAARDAALDALLGGLADALDAAGTLGGLCSWIEASAPETATEKVEGGPTIRAALVTVTLNYSTTNPLR